MKTAVNLKTPTIDINEVSRYKEVSDIWWNTSGKVRGLHSLNRIRVPLVTDAIVKNGHKISDPSQPLKGISIIDVGCGGGILTEALARTGATMTGIDPSLELIMVAKEHASLDSSLSKNLNYIQTSVDELVQTNTKKYDAVVSSEVLEHVMDQEMFIKYCTELLRPGGVIILTTINKTFISWFWGIIVAEYILKFIPKGTHDWNKFISPSDTQGLLKKYNCETTSLQGMVYNPLKNVWNWSSWTSIFYAIQAIKKVD
ncbi:ubiquinone biosynthesis O-methyltransferase, mitochondrial-like [Leptopilina heterotoma]|uniref:ubiquinone biosynthesis O-methyltransferase, mitochondrial-like n=1 Tax=Leptopilina heterotoma TaxID=63436 RepID=UPI001CA7FBCC|nr:ubiquinone biosynthesis O-methyltransferase, mitochondrial-like [Leptopilina heterotoma]XP_043468903.1 ubiquinone biosynthesis O-methyltransferase, mitochondrial-like [Leptopilina heterotoma]XP_043468904.1 ubiquinone biosynthesis O-methyltransferase, mitochondrial-like [Leptopilina heterotoma]